MEQDAVNGAGTSPGDITLAVEHAHPWQGLVAVETPCEGAGHDMVLLDEHGQSIPFQVVDEGRALAFVAHVAEGGRATFRLTPRPPQATFFREVYASRTELDNMDLRLELDPATGTPSSLIERRTCEEYLDGVGWAGGVVSPAASEGDVVFHSVVTTCVERGPVRSTLRTESFLGGCRLVQEFRLHRELPFVEVTATVHWDESSELICLGYGVATCREDSPVEAHSSRESGAACAWRWVDVSQPEAIGLALLHGPGASAQALERTLRLEIRKVAAGDSKTTVRYALMPHSGDWREAGVEAAAALLATPPCVRSSGC